MLCHQTKTNFRVYRGITTERYQGTALKKCKTVGHSKSQNRLRVNEKL